MRVIQAIAGAPRGGAEAFYARLVPALTRAGLDQMAITRPVAERRRALDGAGVPTLEMGFGSPYLDILSRWRFRKAIAEFGPDIVVTWANRASAICPSSPVAGRKFLKVGRLGGYYDPKYYRDCHHLVGNTPGICAYLRDQGWPAERVHHVPNFVDPPKGPPVARATIGTPSNVTLMVALGRLHANKAFDTLLKALALVPGVHLWLAGSGPEEAALKVLAGELGVTDRVSFLGWREDAANLVAAADIFCCPSRHEPFGNVVAEAWAAGRPVVATAASGPKMLLRHETDGLLVPVDDVPALATAIARLDADRLLGARLAAAGKTRYEADFSEVSVVRQWLDFFERVSGKAALPAKAEGETPCAASPA